MSSLAAVVTELVVGVTLLLPFPKAVSVVVAVCARSASCWLLPLLEVFPLLLGQSLHSLASVCCLLLVFPCHLYNVWVGGTDEVVHLGKYLYIFLIVDLIIIGALPVASGLIVGSAPLP